MWLKRSEYVALVRGDGSSIKPLVDEVKALRSEVRALRTTVQRRVDNLTDEDQGDGGPIAVHNGLFGAVVHHG